MAQPFLAPQLLSQSGEAKPFQSNSNLCRYQQFCLAKAAEKSNMFLTNASASIYRFSALNQIGQRTDLETYGIGRGKMQGQLSWAGEKCLHGSTNWCCESRGAQARLSPKACHSDVKLSSERFQTLLQHPTASDVEVAC